MRCTVAVLLTLAAACSSPNSKRPTPTDPVGRTKDGRLVLPQNQTLQPAGQMIELAGLRPQALLLSRDGKQLFVSGKTAELLVLDATTCAVLQRVQMPNDSQTASPTLSAGKVLAPDKEALQSFTGLVLSADGTRLFQSNVNGSIKVYAISASGAVVPSHSLPLQKANAPRRAEEIPSGLALSNDGKRLYVCGNLSNQLLELDAQSGKELRRFAVGVAPYDVVLVGDRAFVSNWGGARPLPGALIGPAGRGTTVSVDPVRFIGNDGSVSVLDLCTGKLVTETKTGLLACALAVAPNQGHVVCANAGSDTVSVLDAKTGMLIETLCAKQNPSDLFGASPNALCFDADGKRLYCANGTHNAIAVFQFEPEDKGDSKLLGMIPVGWYPGALLCDTPRKRIVAANLKGLSPGRERNGQGPEFNSHQYHGSISLVPVPGDEQLPELSARTQLAMRRFAIEDALLPPRSNQAPRAIPERIGEPSLIQHCVYVIKENRTYDQVLGDMKSGNGDPSLCVFGADITPNQHALASQFVLLDNTYCSGILSADGHNWSMSAFANNYLEKSFAGFPRSYPDGMGEDDNDALAYSPAGFLWDQAKLHKITLRNYGEFCGPNVRWRDSSRSGAPGIADCWRTWQGLDFAVVFGCEPSLRSLADCSPRGYVGWNMDVPDQYRADFFLRELAEFTAKGTFPQLTLVCLPNDHTSGTGEGRPTPAACVADNDLALGRILAGLSSSPFWKNMAVFIIEDDPQAGWDHVSGYRTTCYVAGPHVRRGAVVSAQYNTTSVLRTIEQILGIPPMNVFDASASPMVECFTDTPDLLPFNALPSLVSIFDRNPNATAIKDPQLRADAIASAQLDFAHIDKAPEDLLNRILWRAMCGSQKPYPEWAITPGAAGGDGDDR